MTHLRTFVVVVVAGVLAASTAAAADEDWPTLAGVGTVAVTG
jgi:hypothetical protein